MKSIFNLIKYSKDKNNFQTCHNALVKPNSLIGISVAQFFTCTCMQYYEPRVPCLIPCTSSHSDGIINLGLVSMTLLLVGLKTSTLVTNSFTVRERELSYMTPYIFLYGGAEVFLLIEIISVPTVLLQGFTSFSNYIYYLRTASLSFS